MRKLAHSGPLSTSRRMAQRPEALRHDVGDVAVDDADSWVVESPLAEKSGNSPRTRRSMPATFSTTVTRVSADATSRTPRTVAPNPEASDENVSKPVVPRKRDTRRPKEALPSRARRSMAGRRVAREDLGDPAVVAEDESRSPGGPSSSRRRIRRVLTVRGTLMPVVKVQSRCVAIHCSTLATVACDARESRALAAAPSASSLAPGVHGRALPPRELSRVRDTPRASTSRSTGRHRRRPALARRSARRPPGRHPRAESPRGREARARQMRSLRQASTRRSQSPPRRPFARRPRSPN